MFCMGEGDDGRLGVEEDLLRDRHEVVLSFAGR